MNNNTPPTPKPGVGGAPQTLDNTLSTKLGIEPGRFQQLEVLKELPLKRIGIIVITAYVANYVVAMTKDEELRKMDEGINKATVENGQLKQKLEKTKGFEDLKKALDNDEKTIRVKIDTVKKLIADRQLPPKMLQSVSNSIPSDVWLTNLKINEEGINFKGSAVGFGQVSDFMKNVSESAFFTDVKLISSSQTKDEVGQESASFEVSAKRRSEQ
jgi:Tfp pilus assembly protein PilN